MNIVVLMSLFQVILSIVISSLGLWTWNHKVKSLQSHSLLALHLTIASLLLINAFELLATGLEDKYMWGRIQYIPLVILPIAWYLCAKGYSNQNASIDRMEFVLLGLLGGFISLIALTNPYHHLFWSSISLNSESATLYLEQEISIAFVLYLAFVLVLIFVGIYWVIISIQNSGAIQSWQSTMLLISVIAVFGSVALDVSNTVFFPEPELSSLVLAFVIPIVGHTLDKLRYADIIPAAYSQIFENLEDSIIVVTPELQIIDMNRKARSLAGDNNPAPMSHLSSVFPEIASLVERNQSAEISDVVINHDNSRIVLDISISHITDNRSQIQSKIVSLRNVTQRHLRESTLIQQNEELLILNELYEFASASRELPEILNFVAKLICIRFETTVAYVAEVNQSKRELSFLALHAIPDFNSLHDLQKLQQRKFQLNEVSPYISKWLDNPPKYEVLHVDPLAKGTSSLMSEGFEIRSAISIPIYTKIKLYGFMTLIESQVNRDFDLSEIQLLQTLAHLVGSVIENKRLYDEITHEINERSLAEKQLLQSLHEKDNLLKEVHHRVKNNLQVISSLLRLQLSTVNDPRMNALIQDSQSRIQSMALVHELLYQSDNLSTINLGEYLEFLSHSLMATYQVNSSNVGIHADCANLDVNIETAITCGLLLNELVSNALKHAFRSKLNGNIYVSLSPSDNQHTMFVVADDGIGIETNDKTDQNRSSLGLKLIDSFVTQLNAKMKVEVDSGTRYEIRIPNPV